MLTVIGKGLAFLNLVVGIGLAMWSVNLYTNRPAWFDKDAPDAVDKGSTYETFAMLSGEISSLTKTASVVSGSWGEGLTALEKAERTRVYRQGKFAERLKIARAGNPMAGGAAFNQLIEDPETKLTDVDKVGAVVIGPPAPGEKDGQPLRGADTILDIFNRDSAEVARLATEIKAERVKEAAVFVEVQATSTRYDKQSEIRENLVNEFQFLAGFEVNVYEDRETVFKRRAQVQRQLARFGGGN